MSEAPSQNRGADPPNNLNIMAAAAERMGGCTALLSAAAATANEHNEGSAGSVLSQPRSSCSSPPRRPKLVLPNLTPAMQQDLAASKGSSRGGSSASASTSTSMSTSKPLSIGSRPEFADYPLKGIVTPHPNDVLCGRGGGSNNHMGNEAFRELVNEVKVPYVNCPKREKPLIARRIVEAVRNQTPPGRFLSKDASGLWNDIGDGKAREKTSQALREGAPIIRDLITKPTSPTNCANVVSMLKEAKKQERADKEYGVKLPKEEDDAVSRDINQGAEPSTAQNKDSPSFPANALAALKRGKSLGNSPPTIVLSNEAPNSMRPPLKRFRSMTQDHGQPPAVWPPAPQQPGRAFNQMPWQAPTNQARPAMGAFAPAVAHPPPPQRRRPDMVPVETVRRLLLGHLDPVQLALQILSPEEVGIVARRNAASSSGLSQSHAIMSSRAPLAISSALSNPLPLSTLVSDGSSSSSASPADELSPVRNTNATQGSGDEASSVDSSFKQQRALPKKKRKYIAE